jgi:hypothetical protein
MWLRTKANGATVARKGPALAPLVRKTEDQIRALRVVERADADVVLPGSKVAGGAEHDDGDVEQISREVEKAVKKLHGQSLLPQLLEDAKCEWVGMLRESGLDPLLRFDANEMLVSYPGQGIKVVVTSCWTSISFVWRAMSSVRAYGDPARKALYTHWSHQLHSYYGIWMSVACVAGYCFEYEATQTYMPPREGVARAESAPLVL